MEVTPGTDEDILLQHKGPLSQQESEGLFDRIREMAEAGSIPRAAFRAFVELVQNLRLHGGASGDITMWREPGAILIRTSNDATPEMLEHMHAVIDFINDHAKDIHSMMRELRGVELSPFARGAGLGLMEVRRLSGSDILLSKANSESSTNSGLVITVRLEHKS
jgi:hypothetical protein